MNNFVGNVLQNKFDTCCYILPSGTRPKINAHIPTCSAAMLFLVQLVPKPCCF